MGMIPHEFLTFDGKTSVEFGVWISGGGTFNAPTRDMEMVSVPGRNGNLTFDNGRFNNITVTYPAFISREFRPRIDEFRAWICSKHKYCRLEDSYHPDEYRMGIFKGGLNVSPTTLNLAGSFSLAFDCKPQRFLKSGLIPAEYTANGKINNPTYYTANPLITLYGSAGANGAFNIKGGQQIDFVFPVSGTIIIDTDSSEAYDTDGTNLNANISFPNTNKAKDMPRIEPGENSVLMSNVTRAVIVPRWWTL